MFDKRRSTKLEHLRALLSLYACMSDVRVYDCWDSVCHSVSIIWISTCICVSQFANSVRSSISQNIFKFWWSVDFWSCCQSSVIYLHQKMNLNIGKNFTVNYFWEEKTRHLSVEKPHTIIMQSHVIAIINVVSHNGYIQLFVCLSLFHSIRITCDFAA